MKNSNIFSTWLREFCSLVFIQTIQAFIFAIIMMLIISIMTPENVTGVERGDIVSSTGIIAIIALASISKIEDLVKKIFQIQPGVADPSMRGGMKSLATTMMAAKLAGRVGNNFKKIGSGVAGVYSANKEMTKAKGRFARDMKMYGAKGEGAGADQNSQEEKQKINAASGGGSQSNSNNNTGNNGGNSGGNNSNNLEKYYKSLDAYEDKMAALKKKRRDAVFSGISGISETAGAIGFGTIGAVSGAALGEGKEIMTGALAGMGVGDFMGELAVKPLKGASDLSYEINDLRKTSQRFVNDVSNTSAEARRAIENKRSLFAKYRAAKKQYTEFEREVFDAGDVD